MKESYVFDDTKDIVIDLDRILKKAENPEMCVRIKSLKQWINLIDYEVFTECIPSAVIEGGIESFKIEIRKRGKINERIKNNNEN